MYWEKEIETMPREKLEAIQVERLKATLQKAANSYHYGKVYKEKGFNPGDFKSLADVPNLPLTTKDDLRENWPYGFLACSRDELVRMHSSSGTTGRATVIFHTTRDIGAWTNLLARCMYMTGMRRSDVFQNMMTYGLFTGGLGFHYGAEKIGALVIPAGAGNSKRQIQLMRDFETTAIHIIPSYALHLSTVFDGGRRRSPAGHEASDRLSRRRTPLGEDAPEDRGALRLQGLQLLRPLRDERPRRGLRVPGAERDAHLGGQLHRRDHRSRDAEARPRRGGGGAGHDDAPPGGDADPPLPDEGPHPDHPRPLSLRHGPTGGSSGSRGGPTT